MIYRQNDVRSFFFDCTNKTNSSFLFINVCMVNRDNEQHKIILNDNKMIGTKIVNRQIWKFKYEFIDTSYTLHLKKTKLQITLAHWSSMKMEYNPLLKQWLNGLFKVTTSLLFFVIDILATF